MTKKNTITVAEVINSELLTPDEMRKLLKDFQSLKAQISKLPKDQLKEIKAELGRVSKRVISGKLLELKDRLVPILKEYRDDLKEEFKKTITKDKPFGNRSISFRADIFNLAVIRSIPKKKGD